MKFRTTLILLALVVGLGCFFIFHTARQPTGRDYREQQKRVFPAREFEDPASPARRGLSDRVSRIELRQGDKKIVLARDRVGDMNQGRAAPDFVSPEVVRWTIEQPIRTAADSGEVSSILSALEFMEVQAVLRDEPGKPLDPASFGLRRPSRSITFGVGDKSWTLKIGDETADGRSVYVARADDPKPVVYVVQRGIALKASRETADLRDKAAFRFDRTKVTAVDVTVDGERIRLARDDGVWQMSVGDMNQGRAAPDFVSPEIVADGARVEAFLDDLLGIAVRKWIDEPDAERVVRAGLSPPRATIALTMKDDASPRELRIGNRAPGSVLYHARRGEAGPILLIPPEIPTRLSAGRLAFLSRKVMEFKRGDAVALRIERPDGTFRIEKQDGKWTALQPVHAEADADAIDDILWTLCYLEADRLAAENPDSLSEYGLDAPRITAAISLKSGPKRREVLLVGKECEDGTSYATTEGGGRVFLVGKATVDALMARLTAGQRKTEDAP